MMMKTLLVFAAPAALLAACTSPEVPDDGREAEAAARDIDLAAASPSPSPAVAEGDLPPCPGINPDIRRPPGSNCLGITPDQCGADKAQGYVGKPGDAAARKELEALAVGKFRWIPHMTPTNDDLRPDRLNVELDASGNIAKVDCY